jgi:hypothetical protein
LDEKFCSKISKCEKVKKQLMPSAIKLSFGDLINKTSKLLKKQAFIVVNSSYTYRYMYV